MVTLTRVFLYPRCATSILATSSAYSAVAGLTGPAGSVTVYAANSVTADASSSTLLAVLTEGMPDWRLLRVLPLATLLEWGICCTNHLDPPCGCRMICSSNLMGATAAESSSITMIEAWSFCGVRSVATTFHFLAVWCSPRSTRGWET